MNADKRKALEQLGYQFGDFADFLGIDEVERSVNEFRANLGSAMRRLRQSLGRTQAAFAKTIGSTQPKVARMEIAAPEVSLDLMLGAYHAAGGAVRYEFGPCIEPSHAHEAQVGGPITRPSGREVEGSPRRGEAAKLA